jgi:hypothetical protein
VSVYSPIGFGYLQQAEAYFLGLTQIGLMLSARDVELLRGWREAGIPIEVVCRGLRAAFDAFEEPPRSMWNCRKFVAVEISAWKVRIAGTHAQDAPAPDPRPRLRKLRDPTRVAEEPVAPEEPEEAPQRDMPAVWERSLRVLIEAGTAVEDRRIKAAYRRAWKAMQDLQETEELGAVALAIGEIEAEFFEEVMGTLTEAERHALDSKLAPRMVAALRGMSADARALQLRVWRRPALGNLGAVPFFEP